MVISRKVAVGSRDTGVVVRSGPRDIVRCQIPETTVSLPVETGIHFRLDKAWSQTWTPINLFMF